MIVNGQEFEARDTKPETWDTLAINIGGNANFDGILWIESPNVVAFGANCQLNGVIVGDGCVGSTAGNQLDLAGNFATGPYPQGEDFAALQTLVGTSIVAPGFPISFTGNFSAIDGGQAAISP